MAVATRLKDLFEKRKVEYEVLDHAPAFTAQEEAAATHVPGRNWAKTVVLLVDGDPVLAVLPATRRLDLDAFARAAGAKEVELADEEVFRRLYPDCEPGAMPPFGHLYDQTTFVDESLREDEYIAFHAGDHKTAIKLPYAVFEELEEPVAALFSES
ncbi:MAG: deacylase [Gemmatimonadetes bacterium]|nr:YbaK/EbsC family protein [Gemmatimonadota bacterium]NIR78310.1 YbaK/EbsC family protein [Gemmatimonadota bacterium]NIT90091.1 YbaK/EbsC family protein [Gemmatimonadota bacterium]NIU30758.1 YbaK/EbsC family protein [Gemmatimonadota bacterium]NIU35551.1 deacylase [Gemmatimonadota bacterium]